MPGAHARQRAQVVSTHVRADSVWPPNGCPALRCSLVYEAIIAAIRDELAAALQRAAAAAAAARASEERVQESMHYSRDKFVAMEAEVKSLSQVRGHYPVAVVQVVQW